jgi:rubrerythrin
LNLGRAFVNPQGAHVSVKALDCVAAHEAAAAVYLQRAIDDAARRFGGEELGLAGFARDALRIAIATERSGLDFYTRAASVTRDARGRRVFEKLAEEEKEHLGTLEARYAQLLQMDPELEGRPTFLFFKGAANGLFAAGADQLTKGVDDRQALMIGIRCERGSHRFFKRYGERFEDSEGKKIFLEFADEERAHLDLLIREYRSLVERQRRGGRAPRRKPRQQATA